MRRPGMGGMGGNKSFNDRRNLNGSSSGGRPMTHGSRMPGAGMQDAARKRPWEGGHDDQAAKRGGYAGSSRFTPNASNGSAYTTGSGGYSAGAPKSFSGAGVGYNRAPATAAVSGYQQPRAYTKPTGYEQKPPPVLTTVPPPAMTYPNAYNPYQSMQQFTQYPAMSFAFPPPTTSVMPPLPKN
jgi:hypothetical protein